MTRQIKKTRLMIKADTTIQLETIYGDMQENRIVPENLELFFRRYITKTIEYNAKKI